MQRATCVAGPRATKRTSLHIRLFLRRTSAILHRTMSLPAGDEAGHVIEWLGSTTEIQGYKELQARQEGLLAAVERRVQELEEASDRRQRAEDRLRRAGFDANQPKHRRWLGDALAIVQAQLATENLVAVRDSAGRISVNVPQGAT